MFQIRPRADGDFSLVLAWVPDAESLYLFSGSRLRWPLDEGQLREMDRLPGLRAWMLIELGAVDPIGHFDLTLDGASARLGRVLVAPEMRGRGLGHVLVGFAIEQARALGARNLSLNVIVGNEAAIRTYERAGFKHVSDSSRPDVRVMTLAL